MRRPAELRARRLARRRPLRGSRLRPRPSGDHFDWAGVGHFVLLVVHSVRRHRLLFVGLWVLVVAGSVALMLGLPKQYQVDTTLQAVRAQLIPALSGGSIPEQVDAPTRAAADTVLRHDNLLFLAHKTDLLNRWTQNRAPLQRLKDTLWARFFRHPSDEERLEALVQYLEKKLTVTTREGAVSIGIEWPDAAQAFDLVEAAQQSFLEARTEVEISSITEAISLLNSRAVKAHDVLDWNLAQLQKLRTARADRLGLKRRGSLTLALPAIPDIETSQLLERVQARRRALADMEDFGRRRVTELETRLEEQRAHYSEPHPVVLDIHQSLEEAKHESPDVAALKRELAPLEAELKRRGFVPDAPLGAERRELLFQAAVLESLDPTEDEDPDIEYAKSQVRHALARYNDTLDRIETARLEQDAARAAFKYRYAVIHPAQHPRTPSKPRPELVVLASLLAGFLVALMGTAQIDLRCRRVLEPWQLEQTLGAPVLARVVPGGTNPARALWNALVGRSWNTVGVLSLGPPEDGLSLAEDIRAFGARDHHRPLQLVDARGVDGPGLDALLARLVPPAGAGPRPALVIALDSPLQNAITIDLLPRCDLVICAAEEGRTLLPDLRALRRWVAPGRLLGAVLSGR